MAASRSSNPSSAATSIASSSEPGAAFLLLHGPVPAVAVHLDLQIGDHRVRRRCARSRPRPPPAFPARANGGRPAACTVRAPRWCACRLATTPTFTVTPGHRPLRSCSAMIVWAAWSSALRPFSGSTPAWAARPVDVDRVVRDALARADDVTVRPRALQDERRVVLRRQVALIIGPAERRADLLVRVADVGDALEPVEPGRLQHLHREEAGEQAALHVGHAGPARDVSVDRERRPPRCRRRTRCPCVPPTRPRSAGPAEGADGDRPGVVHRPRARGPPLDLHPPSRNRASHMSAIALTPAGEYEPQSTFTICAKVATKSSKRAAAGRAAQGRPCG